MRWSAFFLWLIPAISFAQNWNIDLDKDVFGVPWGASESELVEALGEPNGYFNISRFRKLVYYGKSHSFLLVNNQLKGYYLHEYNQTNLLNESVVVNQEFDRATVTINGKDIMDKSFADVESALGVDLGDPDYSTSYITDFVSVEFSFSSTTIAASRSYRLGGLKILYQL